MPLRRQLGEVVVIKEEHIPAISTLQVWAWLGSRRMAFGHSLHLRAYYHMSSDTLWATCRWLLVSFCSALRAQVL